MPLTSPFLPRKRERNEGYFVKQAGFRCYNGTPFLGEAIETEETESIVMNKLRNGGAMIIGIANMHQLGMGTTGCNGSP